MADIFNEIDEELRGDQMRRLWATYSGVFIVVAILIVLGVAGWRGWEYWAEQTAKADGDKYMAALQLSAKGDYQGAEAALHDLQSAGNAGYRTLARLRAADELVSAGDAAGALAAFDAIAKDAATPAPFNGLAAIRAAYLAIDIEDRDKFDARVKPLSVAGNPWRHAARELLAVSAWKADDVAGAKSWVDQIETDADTPADLTNRITLLSSVISAAKKPDIPAPQPAASTPTPAAPVTTPATPPAALTPVVPAPAVPAPVAPSDAPVTTPPAAATPAAPVPTPSTTEPAPAAPSAPATKVE